ncbi:PqiC family protein [Falsigemmobacter faecalis]|nr:PqiC family protein [Falsigemmobacter faecalis]
MKQVSPVLLLCALALAACGGSNPARFLPEVAGSVPQQRLRIATIELRDIVLPAYGSAADILSEGPDGALKALKGAEWADNSAEALTADLARRLDLGGTASVAAEPWPLSEPADIRLEVRIDRILAARDGTFRISGQFAVASPDLRMREFLERFAISVPLTDPTPAGIAAAYGRALDDLSSRILLRLAR